MKRLKFFIFTLFLALLISPSVLANNVEEMNIDVLIYENGDALVTQTWTGDFYEGTENYIVIENLNGISIENFSVSQDGKSFEFVNNWDVSLSRAKKEGKCGIVKTKKGYELCFGIGDFGKNTYEFSYLLKDFIASYTDRDGVNFMFVNPGMSTFPTSVKLTARMENEKSITDSSFDIWGFGCRGEVVFSDGNIVFESYTPLKDRDYFVLLLSAEKGIFTPKRAFDYSFEIVKDEAFKGSDYGERENVGEILIVIIFVLVILAILIALIVYFSIISAERKRFSNEAPYFRDTPNGANIEMTYFLGLKFGIIKDESAIIGANILRMMNEGSVSPETKEGKGIFKKDETEIKLLSPPDDEWLLKLFDIMKVASGADGALQEKELEKYASRNYKKLRSYINKIKDKGETDFHQAQGFLSGSSSRIKGLTEKGKKELSEIFGLKKYLEDFSLIAEREIKEISIWQDYLVYATLFGIADKVIEDMKKIYPTHLPEIEEYSRRVNMSGVYYHSLYHSMLSAEQRARSAGSGGGVSFRGGGGFSGGGFGGGSR